MAEMEVLFVKISTRGRYGLKIIVDLAGLLDDGQNAIANIKSIAKRQGLPENYIEQLIAPLKKAGYVKSVRGAQGGYLLAMLPEEITVGAVLRSLEGSLAPVDCVEERESGCGDADCGTCVTKSVWSKINDSLNDVVDSITIKDMLEDSYARK